MPGSTVFDPSSPFVSYWDVGACGDRGNDARADPFACRGGAMRLRWTLTADNQHAVPRPMLMGGEQHSIHHRGAHGQASPTAAYTWQQLSQELIVPAILLHTF
eukprot:1222819-Pleurochrysis_carterae.AAC.2